MAIERWDTNISPAYMRRLGRIGRAQAMREANKKAHIVSDKEFGCGWHCSAGGFTGVGGSPREAYRHAFGC